MAPQETFYEQRSLDRTPYQACIWVALLLILTFGAGLAGLWKAASYWKEHVRVPTVQKPNLKTDAVFGDIQQQLTDQAKQKQQEALDAAAEAAKNAAQQQVQQQVENQKEQYESYLQK